MDRDEYSQVIFVAGGGRESECATRRELDAKFMWPQVKADNFLHALSVQYDRLEHRKASQARS